MSPPKLKKKINPITSPFEQVVSKVLNTPTIPESFIEFPKEFPHSPLRYPGGKNRAIKEIYSCIPSNETILCSPFLGGASVELACTTRMEVRGYDIFEPLVDFWNVLVDDPDKLADAVLHAQPLATVFLVEQA